MDKASCLMTARFIYINQVKSSLVNAKALVIRETIGFD